MNEVIRAAADLRDVCETRRWRYCFIGGLAVLRWGEPRETVDITLGGLPFEESVVDRSSPFTFPPDVVLRTCSAEDLIVLKAFADRPKDWVDIDGIIVRHCLQLDWTYVVRTRAAGRAQRGTGHSAATRATADRPRVVGRISQSGGTASLVLSCST